MSDHGKYTKLILAAGIGLAVLTALAALELPGQSYVALIVIFVICPLLMVLMARGSARRGNRGRRRL